MARVQGSQKNRTAPNIIGLVSIRNVPTDTWKILKKNAAMHGLTISEYLTLIVLESDRVGKNGKTH